MVVSDAEVLKMKLIQLNLTMIVDKEEDSNKGKEQIGHRIKGYFKRLIDEIIYLISRVDL